jgi:uncharacterized membrane protein
LKRSHALMPHNNRTILLKLFEGTFLPSSFLVSLALTFPHTFLFYEQLAKLYQSLKS